MLFRLILFFYLYLFLIIECLWKVCSWALDKRALRSSVSLPSNPVDVLTKLFY